MLTIVEVDVFCSILKRFDTELELNLQIEIYYQFHVLFSYYHGFP